MVYKERGSHARGVYPTQYTSGMGTARERKRHKNNVRIVRNLEERCVGTKRKSPKQDLTSVKDLTIELSEGRESPYHRLDELNHLTYGS